MKVKELIENLSRIDEDSDVVIWTCSGEWSRSVAIEEMFKTHNGRLVIDDGEAINSNDKEATPLFTKE